MGKKNSNPDLIKISSDNTNINSVRFENIENAVKSNLTTKKKLLGKSVRNDIKKLNLNLINNISSYDESIKTKENDEKEKNQLN